jgi:hypothetical protein
VKPLDWLFLCLSFALTVGTAWVVLAPTDAPLRVEVQDADGTSVYPLNEDRQINAKGPLGLTDIHIEHGGVFVHDSPCTNKVCIAMGTIRASGQFVACLPNRVFVRITGGAPSPEAPDAGVW